MRVFELARELGRPSKEVITILNGMGIMVTSHASVIDADVARKVREYYIREGILPAVSKEEPGETAVATVETGPPTPAVETGPAVPVPTAKEEVMFVGIDFGTTYTKIAYVTNDGRVDLFHYPGEQGSIYIPTAVAYRRVDGQEFVTIGEAARKDFFNTPGVIYVETFKMFLPLSRNPEKLQSKKWNCHKSPDQVLRDYFRHLLQVGEYSLFQRMGRPERIVVSVPELWQRTANNPGAEVIRHVLIEELGLPVDRLLSEPVCAAAAYLYEHQQVYRGFEPFNLLVCDIGGGTFDVALCRLSPGKIEVLDFDGSGELGTGSAGALFDRRAVERALTKQGDRNIGEIEMKELLCAFEEVKLARHDNIRSALDNVAHLPNWEQVLADTEAYRFRRRYALTFREILECFEPVARAIEEVLERLHRRAQERKLSIDRVTIVGGFGQFPLVRYRVRQTLGLQGRRDPRFDEEVHRRLDQFGAIARGAALIASRQIKAVEYYPHTIGLEVMVKSSQGLRSDYLVIVEAGKVEAGSEEPVWASRGGQKVVVQVEERGSGELPVYIQLRGQGNRIKLHTEKEQYPDPGQYYVGFRIDSSNMGILVFKSTDGKTRREYRLGNVRPAFVVEEEAR